MITVPERHVKTGGDPRTLAAWTSLRGELSKLAHPARPDINWVYAETLCLNLFEHNGVELQTAAWYTLIRSKLNGLQGMNEGLSILDALVVRQWGSLWPQAVHARVEILNTLARRLQEQLRTRVLSYTDLGTLYQAEQHLSAMTDALQRLELKHQTGLDALYRQIHQAAVRLENGSDVPDSVPAPSATLPAATTINSANVPPSRLVWILPAPTEPRITVLPVPPSRSWRPFVAGMLTMLVTGILTLWGWHQFTDNPAQRALMATVAPLPSADLYGGLPPAGAVSDGGRQAWFTLANRRLGELATLPPGWSLHYGSALVRQAQARWPDSPDTAAMARRWQHSIEVSVPTADSLTGWHQGMTRLAQLADRLNGLDEQKGRYMTVSELKSQVFALTQAFSRTVPAEEQLRRLSAPDTDGTAALRTETAQHIRSLQAAYGQLTKAEPQGGEHAE